MSKYYVREDDAGYDGVRGPAVLTIRANTAAAQSGADGDFSPLITDTNGKLWVNASGIALGAPADGTYIGDIKFGESLPAGSATIGKLAANSGVDIGDVDVTSLPSLPSGSNAIGSVTLGAGSAAIGKLAANSGVDIGDVDVTSLPASTNTIEVVGDVAEDAVAAGNPVLIGGKAKAPGAAPGEVAADDAIALRTDLQGRLMVNNGGIHTYSNSTSITESGAFAATTVAAAVTSPSNMRFYITDIMISTVSTGTTSLTFSDTGATLFVVPPAPAGYVSTLNFAQPVRCPTDGSVLRVAGSAAFTGYIFVNGYYGT